MSGTLNALNGEEGGPACPLHYDVCVRLACRLPEDRESLLRRVNAFLSRPQESRARAYRKPSMI